ncbi:MAG: histidine phosphatase family protein [Paracoccaceae bacterium]|nr:histidine phosphatase family protein [Paracoccaceae bacterium]
MTLRLILIRHAKSSWDDPFSDDHARVLNKRGHTSAKAIGAWLAVQDYVPEVLLCSDATRTQETAEHILASLTPSPQLRLSKMLYHAAPNTILDIIRKETAKTISVIGHNPGIGMLANMLVAKAPAHNRFSDYPTCATTIIDFEAEAWSDVERGAGTCKAFVVPRDLIGTTGQDMD